MNPLARSPGHPVRCVANARGRGRWSQVSCLSSLAALLWLTYPAPRAEAQVNLPALGDAVSDDFDLNDERRLGERIMRAIRQDPDYLDDPQLSDYLNLIWQPLLEAARERGEIDPDKDRLFPWETFQVRDRSINAFALPGGYVGVHLGLIAMTASSDELASVLAHELTHITQRHIARSMANSQRQSTGALAAMLLGLVLASRAGSVDGINAVLVGSQAAIAQGQLNFSREMEREADRIGLQLMTRAGFAPSGMAAMFEKLDYSARLNDGNQFPYLRSHPLTIERISEARLRAAGGVGVRPVSPVLHALMQVRARALMDTSEPALRRLQTLAAPGSPAVDTGRLATLYGGALASLMLREFDKALELAQAGQQLQARLAPGDAPAARPFALLQLEAYAASGALREGFATVLKSLAPDHSRPALLAQAQAALAQRRAGQPAAALALRNSIESLQTWVTEHKQDVLAWQALGQCADAQGLRLRSLRAGAEASAAAGDVIGAVERFRMAQHIASEDAGADYLEASIIQTRLRDMEAERRKLIAEMRGERRE